MLIKSLSLTNFRCFQRAEVVFSDKLNLLYGGNAQGKTSVLEAIHLVSLLTSPIASQDRELINFQSLENEIPVGRIVAVIEKNNQTVKIEIRLILESTINGINRLKKEVLIDGVKKRLYDAVGVFNSVLFLPQMMRIIEDGPDERRKYLDQMLSQAYPGYVKALNMYQKTIVKRNALLKRLFEIGGDHNQLDYWDQLISEKGAFIIRHRGMVLTELDKLSCLKHREVTSGNEEVSIRYAPSLSSEQSIGRQLQFDTDENLFTNQSEDCIREQFLSKLYNVRKEEIQRGFTTIGPHRDNILFYLNGVDIGKYGSRGQIRSVVMSLKFAEKEWLEDKTQDKPVLLLDETLAELDISRRDGLIDLLNNHSQVVLTTADQEILPERLISRCSVWKVDNHKIVGE